MVQGLQYCVHPEIQAKYLVTTNGAHTCVHDVHGVIFLDMDIYAPILEFTSAELPQIKRLIRAHSKAILRWCLATTFLLLRSERRAPHYEVSSSDVRDVVPQ